MGEAQANPADGTLDRMIERFGIRARAYWALTRSYALMDLRSQQFGRATATGANAIITPLFWVIGQYLLVSIGGAVILFGRVDARFYALANLGLSMLVLATAIIVEFNEVVLDANDLGIIGHHPVPTRTYSAARLTNLLGYVLLMTASLIIVPAIVGIGLRDADWRFLPAFLAAGLVGNLLTAAVIIVLYTLIMKTVPAEQSRDTLAWTQIILILVLFYGGQMVFRDTSARLEMTAYNLPDWVNKLPNACLADFVDSFVNASHVAWLPLAAMAGLTVIAWAAAGYGLSKAYAQLQPGGSGSGSGSAWQRVDLPRLATPGMLGGRLTRLLVKPGVETASFWLCSTMLRRDSDLRMRSWPTVAMPLAALAMGGFTGQLGNPLGGGRESALSLASLYLLAAPLPAIMNNLRFTREHAAAWVLHNAPIADGAALADGARKAVTYRIILPTFIVVIGVLAMLWRQPVSIALHAAAAWLAILLAGHVATIGVLTDPPLSQPLARGQTMGPVVLWSGIVSGLAMMLALLHYAAARNVMGLAGLVAGLLVAVILVRAVGRRAMRNRFGGAHE